MSLLPRPSSPGDRLAWRPTIAPAGRQPIAPGFDLTIVEPHPAVDRADLDAEAVDLERRAAVRSALGHLTSGVRAGRSADYRRERALIELRASVQRQTLIDGLGHVHVGTPPCGPMCQPLGAHADAWRGR